MEAGEKRTTGLTAAERQILAERRSEFWRDVAKVAIGVCLGLILWTVTIWVVASPIVEDALNDEPSITLGE